MTILVLNYEYPPIGGGAAPVCRDLAVRMAGTGHKVTVLTMGYGNLASHETIDGVEIIRVRSLRKNKSSCMPWEQLSFIIAAKRFLKYYSENHPFDICHSHFVVPTGPVALWTKRHYGVPYIITAHGSDVEGHNRKMSLRMMHRILRPAWKTIVREAYCVAAPSEHLLQLMDRTFHRGRYTLIPNGLKIEKYKSSGSHKDKRILIMGRLQKFKNIQTILKAVARISADQWNGWQIDILGDGPYRGELERCAKKLGIQERIMFRGWLDNGSEEQLACLKGASIYLSASLFENCPMAVLEAVSAGCRPLLSDIEGHRQFFKGEDDQDQYFFPPNDDVQLSEKLMGLLIKPPVDLYTDIDLSRYDLEHVTGQYIELLEKAAKNGIKT